MLKFHFEQLSFNKNVSYKNDLNQFTNTQIMACYSRNLKIALFYRVKCNFTNVNRTHFGCKKYNFHEKQPSNLNLDYRIDLKNEVLLIFFNSLYSVRILGHWTTNRFLPTKLLQTSFLKGKWHWKSWKLPIVSFGPYFVFNCFKIAL